MSPDSTYEQFQYSKYVATYDTLELLSLTIQIRVADHSKVNPFNLKIDLLGSRRAGNRVAPQMAVKYSEGGSRIDPVRHSCSGANLE